MAGESVPGLGQPRPGHSAAHLALLHLWDVVVIRQTHAKYGLFISALAGAVLAYNQQPSKWTTDGMLIVAQHRLPDVGPIAVSCGICRH